MLRCLGLVAVAAILVGCGESKVPVSGAITLSGEPLGDVRVIFQGSEGKFGFANVDSSGQFQVTSEKPGDGIPAGSYQIGVTPISPASEQPSGQEDYSAPPPAKFSEKYFNPDTSGLNVQVEPGMGPITLELTQ